MNKPHNCSHGHHHHHHHNQGNILFAFFLNFAFSMIEFIGAYLTNSMAIYSDALHDLGDCVGLLMAYFAEKFSTKKADSKFNFGYKRLSILAALFNGLILLLGSGFIIHEAIARLNNPQQVNAKGVLILAIFGFVINSWAAYKMSKNTGVNSKMIMLHLLEDIFGWLAVLIMSVILLFKPWYFLDPILSLIIAFMLISGVLKNMMGIGKILMQAFPDGIDRDELEKDIRKMNNVMDVHLIQGWSMDDSSVNISFHVVVPSELKMKEVDELRQNIEKYLSEKNIEHMTIQFEGDECNKNSPRFKPIQKNSSFIFR